LEIGLKRSSSKKNYHAFNKARHVRYARTRGCAARPCWQRYTNMINPIRILIIVFGIIISLSGISDTGPASLPVSIEYQSCKSNDDCDSVQTTCSDCDCGTAINKKFIHTYEIEKSATCSNYQGAVCDIICVNKVSACENNICIYKYGQ